ncbi:MAG: hypothetical protein PVF73_12510 [Bacteroidales bacterium]|jgi:hypothetical protein
MQKAIVIILMLLSLFLNVYVANEKDPVFAENNLFIKDPLSFEPEKQITEESRDTTISPQQNLPVVF